MKMEAVFNSK